VRNIARVRPDEIGEIGEISEIRRLLGIAPAAQGYLAVATERGTRSYLLGPRTHAGNRRVLTRRVSP